MKTELMIVLVALACVGCEPPAPPEFDKWEIVQGTNGTYGFVDWSGKIRVGFRTCEDARNERDWSRKWSDAYDNAGNRSFWKKAECP